MPRTARNLIDGATYHVMTQGNNNQTVFHHDADYEHYLSLLASYVKHYRLNLYNYVLMPNHVHLLLQINSGPSLSKAMSGLSLSYTLYFQKRYTYSGHLWRGRFKSFLINPNKSLLKYGRNIELNPINAHLVQDPAIYSWSSYRTYAEGEINTLLTINPAYTQLGSSDEHRQVSYRQFVMDGINFCRAEQADALPRSVQDLSKWLNIPSLSAQTQQANINGQNK